MTKKILNSDIFKEPVISKNKNSFLEKLYRKIEANSFQPLQIGSEKSLNHVIEMIVNDSDKQFFSQTSPLECLHVREAQADLMIVHGHVSRKMEPYILDCYNKMGKPTYVIRVKNKIWEQFASKEHSSLIFDEFIIPDIEIDLEELTSERLLNELNKLKEKIKNGK